MMELFKGWFGIGPAGRRHKAQKLYKKINSDESISAAIAHRGVHEIQMSSNKRWDRMDQVFIDTNEYLGNHFVPLVQLVAGIAAANCPSTAMAYMIRQEPRHGALHVYSSAVHLTEKSHTTLEGIPETGSTIGRWVLQAHIRVLLEDMYNSTKLSHASNLSPSGIRQAIVAAVSEVDQVSDKPIDTLIVTSTEALDAVIEATRSTFLPSAYGNLPLQTRGVICGLSEECRHSIQVVYAPDAGSTLKDKEILLVRSGRNGASEASVCLVVNSPFTVHRDANNKVVRVGIAQALGKVAPEVPSLMKKIQVLS